MKRFPRFFLLLCAIHGDALQRFPGPCIKRTSKNFSIQLSWQRFHSGSSQVTANKSSALCSSVIFASCAHEVVSSSLASFKKILCVYLFSPASPVFSHPVKHGYEKYAALMLCIFLLCIFCYRDYTGATIFICIHLRTRYAIGKMSAGILRRRFVFQRAS